MDSFEYSCRYRDISKCTLNTLRKLVFRFYLLSDTSIRSIFGRKFVQTFTIYLTSLTRTTSLFPTPDISKCILIYNRHTYVYTICNYEILHIRHIRLEIASKFLTSQYDHDSPVSPWLMKFQKVTAIYA